MPYAKKGKAQSSIFFDLDVHEAMKVYVKNQAISLSSYVNSLVKKEMVRLGQMIDTDADSIAELVDRNYERLLKDTEIPKEILDQLRRGAKPDEITLLRIHGGLHIPEVKLKKLLAKSKFEEKKKPSMTLEQSNKGLRRT